MKHPCGEDWQQGGFGLYVHWPFCQTKCPYCDFNSHVAASVDHAHWRERLVQDLRQYAQMTPDRVLNSIFFGGGTPSLMQPQTVAAIIDAAVEVWRPANDLEITLEANPGSVEAARFAAYRDAGVNRVSLGVQALNDTDLQRLGRLHSLAEARAALDIAQREFDRVSFDLIYARQDQTLAQWEAELREAIALSSGHLSLYQLTIEEGTVFARRLARGQLHGLPSEDLAADFYDLTQQLCEDHGLPAYEVSNHAAPEQESRHNLVYWRAGDYVGIGPGAHGRLTLNGQRYPTEAPRLPNRWLHRPADQLSGDIGLPLSGPDRAVEYMMMGLRIDEGIALHRLRHMLGDTAPAQEIADLTGLGLLHQQDDRLTVTPQGRPLLNAILQRLVNAM